MKGLGIAVGLVLAATCRAQHPTFEAASVKLVDPAAPPTYGTTGGPGSNDPGRIHFGRATMIELLRRAFGVGDDLISGPAWIRDFQGPNLYAITATMPPGTTQQQFQGMMQALLADRFHLEVHREARDFPGYELVLAKGGPKLTRSTPEPKPADAGGPPARPRIDSDGFMILPPGSKPGMVQGSGVQRVTYREQSMAGLATALGGLIRLAQGNELGSPEPRVIDKTGLPGQFDMRLEFVCLGCRGLREMAPNLPLLAGNSAAPTTASDPPGAGLPTIFAALEKQLGLHLEKTRNVPVEVIVIDRLDKVPTDN